MRILKWWVFLPAGKNFFHLRRPRRRCTKMAIQTYFCVKIHMQLRFTISPVSGVRKILWKLTKPLLECKYFELSQDHSCIIWLNKIPSCSSVMLSWHLNWCMVGQAPHYLSDQFTTRLAVTGRVTRSQFLNIPFISRVPGRKHFTTV